MEYRYHIKQFRWLEDSKSFYAEAYHLECAMPDGSIHPECFPNQKGQFFIDNPKTGGFRRFRFVKQVETWVKDENENDQWEVIEWEFESEDGIKCYIGIN
jgi:hypothetical protein